MRLTLLPLILLVVSCIGTQEFGTEVTAAQQAQIKPGMSMADVRGICGQPDSVSDNLNDGSKRWIYGHSTVTSTGSEYKQFTVDFTSAGKVVVDGDDGGAKK